MLFCDSTSVLYNLFTVVVTAVYVGDFRLTPVLSKAWLAGEYLRQTIHLHLVTVMEAQHDLAVSIGVVWEVVVDYI